MDAIVGLVWACVIDDALYGGIVQQGLSGSLAQSRKLSIWWLSVGRVKASENCEKAEAHGCSGSKGCCSHV